MSWRVVVFQCFLRLRPRARPAASIRHRFCPYGMLARRKQSYAALPMASEVCAAIKLLRHEDPETLYNLTQPS